MIRAHVIPFFVWIGGIFFVDALSAWVDLPIFIQPIVYAAKTLLCLGLLFWLKPWRAYPALGRSDWLPGLSIGVAVAIFWVLPETGLTTRLFPGFQRFYHEWLILMPGSLPDYYDPAIAPALPASHPSWLYSPERCGWPLTLLKLIGSAFVIAPIEEYFFRGFLYRWLIKADFTSVKLKIFELQPFLLVLVCFGIEHDRWFGGLLAGLCYALLILRTGRIQPAIIAHCTTNLLLGIYVILSRQYGFW